ncbi:hypothetical protein CPB86DRAFT_790211 [Serendipita vermifera]|nr:hypothetical protein CPB86DRAFT_790211 [Serendipita vermifera]
MDNIPTGSQESGKNVAKDIASDALASSASPGPSQEALSRRSLAKELLADQTAQSDINDSERSLNPIVESSGSDHLSDDKESLPNTSRPVSRPRSLSDSRPASVSSSRSPLSFSLITETNQEPNTKLESSSKITTVSIYKPLGGAVNSTNEAPTTSNSAPSTPSEAPKDTSRTYSFVFTSSRQNQILGGDRLIGVVNPSIRRTPSSPRIPFQASSIPARKPTLTPEQIKAHALGAKHAIAEDSPFQTIARERATPSVASIQLPLQTPLTPDGPDPIDRSLQTHGIDFYVNAARAGRVTTREEASTSRPAISTRRSLSYTTTLSSLGENILTDDFQAPSSPTARSEATSSFHKKKRRPRNYSRYVEEDSTEKFISVSSPRQRDASLGSSASSSNSKQSLDESLTGLSCFGMIGSGSAVDVFGSAVLSPSNSPSVQTRPKLLQHPSLALSDTPTPTPGSINPQNG